MNTHAIAIALLSVQCCFGGTTLEWQQLPPLPDALGFAGAFAGVSGRALIVAGGANFPERMPWEGGRKVWHDDVFILERPDGAWRSGFKLPRALGYGVSVTTGDGVICIGGSDAKEHARDVFRLRWRRDELNHEPLAPLPQPLANSCGALIGHTIYIAGGIAAPDATNALKIFWSLDLRQRNATWQQLETWPGPARMLSVAASVGGALYVVGGAELAPDALGKPTRTYLKDAYCFTPKKRWQRVADLPHPVVAAATPAPVMDKKSFLIISGDDGALVNFEPKAQHPGFPKRVLRYDTKSDRWSSLGETPAPRATLPTTTWQGRFILPSGEVRPGVRSPEVWAVRLKDD